MVRDAGRALRDLRREHPAEVRSERGKKLIAGAVSLVLGLVFAEAILRMTVVPVPRTYPFEQGTFVADPAIGYRLAPGRSTVMSDGYFREQIVTNRDGLRDLYDARYPDSGIIAIGDSQTFGHGVAAADDWVELLQERLQVNVINAGVPGYGATQYLPVLLDLERKGYRPRVVLYAMTWNDVVSGLGRPDENTVVDGYLVPNPRHAASGGGLAMRKLGGLVLRTALGRIAVGAGKRVLGRLGVMTDEALESDLREGVARTRQCLLEIQQHLQAVSARLVLVHVSTGNLVMPDLWAEYSRRHRHPRDFARQAFANWCADQGIIFADANAALEQRYLASGSRRESILLPVDAHYNRGGNEVIAQVFEEVIRQCGLRKPPGKADGVPRAGGQAPAPAYCGGSAAGSGPSGRGGNPAQRAIGALPAERLKDRG